MLGKTICSLACALLSATIPYSERSGTASKAIARLNAADNLNQPDTKRPADAAALAAAFPPASASALAPPSTGLSVQPASLFDAVIKGNIQPVTTTVEVQAVEQMFERGAPEPFRAGGQDVLTTAGTFGDLSRYLQLFPGVVASSDFSNQILVRGGHPMENLFLVDGIEVPNINHLANAN